jgi:hypothetical protein
MIDYPALQVPDFEMFPEFLPCERPTAEELTTDFIQQYEGIGNVKLDHFSPLRFFPLFPSDNSGHFPELACSCFINSESTLNTMVSKELIDMSSRQGV